MASGSAAMGEGCTTHFSTLRVQVRPARSIFSNALNFCRSAIAALVRSRTVEARRDQLINAADWRLVRWEGGLEH